MTDEAPGKSQPIEAQKRSETAPERGAEHSASSKVHAEAREGVTDLVSSDKRQLSRDKEDRNLSLGEQIQKTGSANIGTISKQFKCSVEITDGDNVVVKGRSRQEIVEALKYMEQESSKGMLLAPGGQFVSKELGDPQRELISDSSSAGSQRELSSKNSAGDGTLIAIKPGEAKHGSPAGHPKTEQLLKTHPDLAMSEKDKATQTPQLEALRKKVDQDVAKFRELDKWIPEHKAKFHEHLHQATQTKENTPPNEVQAAFERLPKPQRDALLAEQSALDRTGKQYATLVKDSLSPEEQKLFKMSAQINFADNLAKIEQSQTPEASRKVFSSLQSILENKKDTHPVPDEKRREFAYALAEHIANPGAITQGQKDTCQVAAIQNLLLRKDPGFYAEQAAALVTSGSLLFRGDAGATKTAPKSETLLSAAQLNNNDDGIFKRDALSLAMQTALADKNVKIFDPSAGYHYIDAKPGSAPLVNTGSDSAPKYEVAKSGEYVVDAAGHNYPYRGGFDSQETRLLNALTGDHYKAAPEEAIHDSAGLKHLVQKSGAGGYPIILGITAADGAHVISVTNFDAASGKITTMNSADFQSDKPKVQSVQQLYDWLKQQKETYDKSQHKHGAKRSTPGVPITAIHKE